MFAPTRYIAWTKKFYEKVFFDLATSGTPRVKVAELGMRDVDLDDPSAYARLVQTVAHYNDVSPAEVVPALGTSNAIFLAYAATLSPGDEVLVEHPGYEPLIRGAENLGAVVRTFERRSSENFRVVPERVAAAVTPRTRVIAVTNLQNPTGVRTDDATLRELATIAEARGAYLLVDEVYAPFDALALDGVFRTSARKIADNVIAVGSLTKAYGLGMQRIGWMLGPEAVVESANAAVVSSCGHVPLAHANLACAAFPHVGALSKRSLALLGKKRHLADEWVRAIPGAEWSAPAEGLYGFVTLPGRGELLPHVEAAASNDGVLVAAGTFFGVPNGFRLSWASLDADAFATGLAKLRAAMASWDKHGS